MGDYTDQDRERSQETFTMLKDNIKLNDERYDRVGKILEKYEDKFEKQQEKISSNKTRITQVMAVVTFIPGVTGLAVLLKKLFMS